MRQNSSGFTLVEVLVAVVMLSVGVLAMASSSAMVTRMIDRGKMETRAAQAGGRRLEALRLAAYSTTPRCTAGTFVSGGPLTADGITETWTVGAVAGAATLRALTVEVVHRTVRGMHNDTLRSIVEC